MTRTKFAAPICCLFFCAFFSNQILPAPKEKIPKMPSDREMEKCLFTEREMVCRNVTDKLISRINYLEQECRAASTLPNKVKYLNELVEINLNPMASTILEWSDNELDWETICGTFLWEDNTWVSLSTATFESTRLDDLELDLAVGDEQVVAAGIFTRICEEPDSPIEDTCPGPDVYIDNEYWTWGTPIQSTIEVKQSPTDPRLATVRAVGEGNATFGALVSEEAELPDFLGGFGGVTVTVPVDTVVVEPSSITISTGESANLTARLYAASGQELDPVGRNIDWSVDAPEVIDLTASGETAQVKGVDIGSAQISASSEGKTASSVVTVLAPCPDPPVIPDCSVRTPSVRHVQSWPEDEDEAYLCTEGGADWYIHPGDTEILVNEAGCYNFNVRVLSSDVRVLTVTESSNSAPCEDYSGAPAGALLLEGDFQPSPVALSKISADSYATETYIEPKYDPEDVTKSNPLPQEFRILNGSSELTANGAVQFGEKALLMPYSSSDSGPFGIAPDQELFLSYELSSCCAECCGIPPDCGAGRTCDDYVGISFEYWLEDQVGADLNWNIYSSLGGNTYSFWDRGNAGACGNPYKFGASSGGVPNNHCWKARGSIDRRPGWNWAGNSKETAIDATAVESWCGSVNQTPCGGGSGGGYALECTPDDPICNQNPTWKVTLNTGDTIEVAGYFWTGVYGGTCAVFDIFDESWQWKDRLFWQCISEEGKELQSSYQNDGPEELLYLVLNVHGGDPDREQGGNDLWEYGLSFSVKPADCHE